MAALALALGLPSQVAAQAPPGAAGFPYKTTPAGRALYCSVLLGDDLERRKAVRPFLASTDPNAAADADAAIAQDEAAVTRFSASLRARPAPEAPVRDPVGIQAAKDISTLQSLQNAEDGCEATACLTQARAARDADPAWARLKDCQGGVP